MNIEQAKKLSVGSVVLCPPDRGDKGYTGQVTWVGELVQTNYQGFEYISVEVQGPHHKSVWPSNRLG